MRTPALDAWRAELKAGSRSTTTFDPLWQAACAEAWAPEHRDIPTLAASYRAEARRIIRAALEGHPRD